MDSCWCTYVLHHNNDRAPLSDSACRTDEAVEEILPHCVLLCLSSMVRETVPNLLMFDEAAVSTCMYVIGLLGS
jgi:hypothetical protein